MSGSSPPPLSSPLTHNELEPPLAVEMWGLLKALATQLHVSMELATSSSSSSAATEPSPVQDSRHKDKAPASPEDSEDEDEDMSKSILGGKSSSLMQGSDTPLYDVGLLDPRAKSLSDAYEDIVRAVRKVSIGTHCSFPPDNNTGFSKEDLLHVSALCKQFKALHTVLQLCVGLAEDGCVSKHLFSDCHHPLRMRLQLDAQDNIYIKQRYGKETLCHFAILDDSNLVGECQTRLLNAIALAHASTMNQHTNTDSASRNHSRQIGKKKDASPAYPYKTYPKKKGTGAAPSTKSN